MEYQNAGEVWKALENASNRAAIKNIFKSVATQPKAIKLNITKVEKYINSLSTKVENAESIMLFGDTIIDNGEVVYTGKIVDNLARDNEKIANIQKTDAANIAGDRLLIKFMMNWLGAYEKNI